MKVLVVGGEAGSMPGLEDRPESRVRRITAPRECRDVRMAECLSISADDVKVSPPGEKERWT